jgi:hypothetical protein
LKRSKPEWIEERLQPLVAKGFELAELKAAGAQFRYPDGLEPFEWMTLVALQRGESKATALQRKREKKKKK